MCKHVAAVLYGIGARLDHQPELLFTLRKVDQQDLIAKAGSDISKTRKGPASAKVLESDDLSGMFGIEIAPTTPSKRAAAGKITTKPSTGASSKKPSKRRTLAGLAKLRKPAPKRSARKPLLISAKRRAVSARRQEQGATVSRNDCEPERGSTVIDDQSIRLTRRELLGSAIAVPQWAESRAWSQATPVTVNLTAVRARADSSFPPATRTSRASS